jgi:hypothetical protein
MVGCGGAGVAFEGSAGGCGGTDGCEGGKEFNGLLAGGPGESNGEGRLLLSGLPPGGCWFGYMFKL